MRCAKLPLYEVKSVKKQWVVLLLTASLLCACKPREDYKMVYREQGIALLEDGNYPGAIEAFKNSLAESHGFIEDVDYDINKYLGWAYYQNGDYEDALYVYNAILDMTPKDTEVYYYRAVTLLKLERLSEAEEDFLKYTSKYPKDYDVHIDVYFCLMDAGYTTEARSYLQARIQNAKNISDYDLGRISYYLEDYSNARVYLEKAKDMSDPDTILMLGKTYEAIEDYNYAASIYNTYLSNKGNNAAVYNQLGVCRLRMKDYDAAILAFDAGLSLEDEDWKQELLYNEAICYEYTLDFETAYEKLSEYLAIYPKDELAKRELVFLETRK